MMPVLTSNPRAAALYRTALDHRDNWRLTEATAAAREALALDPEFAQAMVVASLMTPGAAGLALLESARAKAASAPEAVRLEVDAALFSRKRDIKQLTAASERISQLAPGDWRVWYRLGLAYNDELHLDAAVAALQKAISLAPELAGPAYNILSGVLIDQGKIDEGVAMTERFVAIAPTEPTAQEGLGDVYVMERRFEDAEATYRKAMALGRVATYGSLAIVRFFRGDWDGGRAVLAEGTSLLPSPLMRFDFDRMRFWSFVAQGKTEEALAAAAAYGRDGAAQNLVGPPVFASIMRAIAYAESATPEKALPPLDAADKELATNPKLEPGTKKRWTSQALGWRGIAEARAGRLAQAERTLARFRKEVTLGAEDYRSQQWFDCATGELKLARGQAGEAAVEFEKCTNGQIDELGPYCTVRRVDALRAANQAGAAAAVASTFLRKLAPSSMYVYAWVKLRGSSGRTP
jgi:tetratricopeptide (TPR) repeat protein